MATFNHLVFNDLNVFYATQKEPTNVLLLPKNMPALRLLHDKANYSSMAAQIERQVSLNRQDHMETSVERSTCQF